MELDTGGSALLDSSVPFISVSSVSGAAAAASVVVPLAFSAASPLTAVPAQMADVSFCCMGPKARLSVIVLPSVAPLPAVSFPTCPDVCSSVVASCALLSVSACDDSISALDEVAASGGEVGFVSSAMEEGGAARGDSRVECYGDVSCHA